MKKKRSTLAVMENIYYTIDFNFEWSNPYFDVLKDKLRMFVFESCSKSDEVTFEVKGIHYTVRRYGIKMYPFCLRVEEKFDIFFAENVGDNSPVMVMMFANFLWSVPVEECLEYSLNAVYEVVNYLTGINKIVERKLDMLVKECDRLGKDWREYPGIKELEHLQIKIVKVNRVDIACHNNLIKDLKKYIPEDKVFYLPVSCFNSLSSNLRRVSNNGSDRNYMRYGRGDIVVRLYDKIREVIEKQYKGQFIKIWHLNGLIDDYTYEIVDYAYRLGKNYDLNIKLAMMEQKENKLNLEKYKSKIISEYDKRYRKLNLNVFEKINERLSAGDAPAAVKYIDRIFMIYNELVPKEKRIKEIKKIFNVEFQLKRSVFKQMLVRQNIAKEGQADLFKYMRINTLNDLLDNADTIWKYCTHNIFRIIDPKTATRRTRCKTEKIWRKIQETKLDNFQCHMDREIIRSYKSELDLVSTMRDINSKLAHLVYITDDLPESTSEDEAMSLMYEKFIDLTENKLIDYDRAVKKQISRYGKKEIRDNKKAAKDSDHFKTE